MFFGNLFYYYFFMLGSNFSIRSFNHKSLLTGNSQLVQSLLAHYTLRFDWLFYFLFDWDFQFNFLVLALCSVEREPLPREQNPMSMISAPSQSAFP